MVRYINTAILLRDVLGVDDLYFKLEFLCYAVSPDFYIFAYYLAFFLRITGFACFIASMVM